MHALYKFAKIKDLRMAQVWRILVTSAIAGAVAYLVAHEDILGLKLNPGVLRTYPLLGFLFSYLGFEALAGKFGVQAEATDRE